VPISSLSLREFRLNGQPLVDLSFLIGRDIPVHGEAQVGNEIRCDVACGFGALEGDYRFVVAASGYEDTTVSLTARYARLEGTCPSRSSDGVRLGITLSAVQVTPSDGSGAAPPP
jgi:hypothetical protein